MFSIVSHFRERVSPIAKKIVRSSRKDRCIEKNIMFHFHCHFFHVGLLFSTLMQSIFILTETLVNAWPLDTLMRRENLTKATANRQQKQSRASEQHQFKLNEIVFGRLDIRQPIKNRFRNSFPFFFCPINGSENPFRCYAVLMALLKTLLSNSIWHLPHQLQTKCDSDCGKAEIRDFFPICQSSAQIVS